MQHLRGWLTIYVHNVLCSAEINISAPIHFANERIVGFSVHKHFILTQGKEVVNIIYSDHVTWWLPGYLSLCLAHLSVQTLIKQVKPSSLSFLSFLVGLSVRYLRYFHSLLRTKCEENFHPNSITFSEAGSWWLFSGWSYSTLLFVASSEDPCTTSHFHLNSSYVK